MLRHHLLTSVGTALFISLLSNTASAGPWTKSKGQFYGKAAQSIYLAHDTSGSGYVGHTTSLYGEVGLGRRVQLHGALPFTVASQSGADSIRHTKAGLADALAGLQWSPFRIPFALAIETSLPLYSLAGADADSPSLGDGQLDQRMTASYGVYAPALRTFASASVGYQHRSTLYPGPRITDPPRFSDGIVFGAQIGRTFFNRPVLSLGAQGEVPFQADAVTRGHVATGLSAFVPLTKRFAVEAGAYLTPWARNASRGTSLSLGVSLRN